MCISSSFLSLLSSGLPGGRNSIPCTSAIPARYQQERIVKKIEQLMQLCDELQYSIQQSKIENEKLLIGALRDALKTEVINS